MQHIKGKPMNETFHAFWYRPLWQQIQPIVIFICLCLGGYYYQYWKDGETKIASLNEINTELVASIQQETHFIRQLPKSSQLKKQINSLNQQIKLDKNPQKFIAQLQTFIINSGVILNQLQPLNTSDTDNYSFRLEIQGTFVHIYHFIQSVILQPSANNWLFTELKLKPKKNNLIAVITISSTKNNVFINDDLHIKDDLFIKDIK